MYFVLYNIKHRYYYHETDYSALCVQDATQYSLSLIAEDVAETLNEANGKGEVEWIVVPISDSYFDSMV